MATAVSGKPRSRPNAPTQLPANLQKQYIYCFWGLFCCACRLGNETPYTLLTRIGARVGSASALLLGADDVRVLRGGLVSCGSRAGAVMPRC